MDKINYLLKTFKKVYGKVETPLIHKNPFQLLVAVILSAQCTDERVNKVTPILFAHFKTPKDFAQCDILELEKLIKSTGFYKTKAKNIRAMSQILVERHQSKVPKTLAELVELPGVGRKTGNVILNEAYDLAEGIVVDTHIGRLAVRLGLTKTTNTKAAEFIEKELMKQFPKKYWRDIALFLIYHGRRVCTARRAYCDMCEVASVCPSKGKVPAYIKGQRGE